VKPHDITLPLLLSIIAGAPRYEEPRATATTHVALSTLERAPLTAGIRYEPLVPELSGYVAWTLVSSRTHWAAPRSTTRRNCISAARFQDTSPTPLPSSRELPPTLAPLLDRTSPGLCVSVFSRPQEQHYVRTQIAGNDRRSGTWYDLDMTNKLQRMIQELRVQREELKDLPRDQRWWVLRQQVQLKVYAAWQKFRGRDFRMPRCDGHSPATYRVTKAIPGIFIPFFGRRIWLLVPVTLEHERVDAHSEDTTH
jgi:hypothetical protein